MNVPKSSPLWTFGPSSSVPCSSPTGPLSRRALLKGLGLGLPLGALLGGCQGLTAGVAPAPLQSREVLRKVRAQPTLEGAGVRLRRSLGTAALGMLDPFLLLDEIRSERAEDVLPGFPRHPHRGFETVSYILDGAMEHRDSLGNQGLLGPGSTQWMTAGKGIIHAEMPRPREGAFWGLQLWVNLPASHKWMRPRYQDLAPERIPELSLGDAQVRVVAGQVGGSSGPVEGIVTAPTLLDLRLGSGGRCEPRVEEGHTAFLYGLEGQLEVGREGVSLASGELAVLGQGAEVWLRSAAGGRALLVAARPLGEPVARRGPFVMNTQAELDQAFADYQAGRLVTGT
jgi:redox-sensitive bicupin YhaK (pirin superfamily)